jgi:two-component system alkaline phosphatase synthesis response regulator PhoP
VSTSSEPTATVLVVDDNEDLLASVSLALKTLGKFRVLVAHDAIEGLEKAVNDQPDCMVIDVKMPEIDGLQLLRALRGDQATAHIPLVVLSALVQPLDERAGMYAGADQYLPKPTKPAVLVEAIRRAIALTDEERQRRLWDLANNKDG